MSIIPKSFRPADKLARPVFPSSGHTINRVPDWALDEERDDITDPREKRLVVMGVIGILAALALTFCAGYLGWLEGRA